MTLGQQMRISGETSYSGAGLQIGTYTTNTGGTNTPNTGAGVGSAPLSAAHSAANPVQSRSGSTSTVPLSNHFEDAKSLAAATGTGSNWVPLGSPELVIEEHKERETTRVELKYMYDA